MKGRIKRSNKVMLLEGAAQKEVQVLVQGCGHHEIFSTPPNPIEMGLKVLAFMTAYGVETHQLSVTVFGNLSHPIRSKK